MINMVTIMDESDISFLISKDMTGVCLKLIENHSNQYVFPSTLLGNVSRSKTAKKIIAVRRKN